MGWLIAGDGVSHCCRWGGSLLETGWLIVGDGGGGSLLEIKVCRGLQYQETHCTDLTLFVCIYCTLGKQLRIETKCQIFLNPPKL